MKKKKKRINKKRKNNIWIVILSSIILLSLVLFGLLSMQYFRENEDLVQVSQIPIEFYFFNNLTDLWESEIRYIDIGNNDEIIQNILDGLDAGPLSPNFNPSIVFGIEIIDFRLLEQYNRLEIVFSNNINLIEGNYITIAITSIVHTLGKLDFVDYIRFFANDQELLRPDGTPLGDLSHDNINLYIPDNPVNALSKEITLYFSDDSAMNLVPEIREININPILISDGSEPYSSVLYELIKGPEGMNLFRTIPENINFNRVERNLNILTIDFSQEFANISIGSTGEFLLFASIVNTFTEFEEISGVQFLINGIHIQDSNHMFQIDFSIPMERFEIES